MFLRRCGFPSLLAISAMLCSAGAAASLRSAAILTGMVLLSMAVTMGVSYLLSRTVLKGEPSSFVLELPPYRRPQVGRILVRSIFERTLVVLGRALMVAAPVNLLIWILANCRMDGVSLLGYAAEFLSPVGLMMGLDGVLLLAFLLGMPANEIVLPVAVTIYTGATQLMDYGTTAELHTLLMQYGWTKTTAVCFLVFMLFHAPCATTLLTIRKETGSLRWMLLAWLLPLAVGAAACIVLNGVLSL